MKTGVRRQRPVGIFVNTARAKCSIFESGEMVAGCLTGSSAYDLHCITLDDLDIHALKDSRCAVSLSGCALPEKVDFWIFNWHFITTANLLEPATIAALPGVKFTVVLELDPIDPLVLVPTGVFDGYLALDPTVEEAGGVFAFPRPLRGHALTHRAPAHRPPVIGSFGFGTPGKGFELLVEAVNREFDEAVVRVNVPPGDYVFCDEIHGRDYPAHIAESCKRIAKPGIRVEFTSVYFSPEELIGWCRENDLNAFMYTRDQPGLSATTDQAILSGQPLITSTNATFRHLHASFAPYPVVSLSEALGADGAAVAALQRAWSASAFRDRFEAMLTSYGIGEAVAPMGGATPAPAAAPSRVRILHPPTGREGDAFDYATRFSRAIARSADRSVAMHGFISIIEAVASTVADRSDAVILLDLPLDDAAGLQAALAGWGIHVVRGVRAQEPQKAEGVALTPIIPFHTTLVALRPDAGVWLIGYDEPDAPLEPVLEALSRQLAPDIRVVLEAAPARASALATRLDEPGPRAAAAGLDISVETLPEHAASIVERLGGERLLVFRDGPGSPDRTEAICSLALATERPVVFDDQAPLLRFGPNLRRLGDKPLAEHMADGVASHIGVLADHGEWTAYAQWRPLLDTAAETGRMVAEEALAAAALSGLLALDGAEFIRGAYLSILGREPDPEGMRVYLGLREAGASRVEIARALATSGEAQARGEAGSAQGLMDDQIRRGLRDLTSATGRELLHEIYVAALGRAPDPDGLAHYQSQLEGGAAPIDILWAIARSGEAEGSRNARAAAATPENGPFRRWASVVWLQKLATLAPDAFMAEVARVFARVDGHASDAPQTLQAREETLRRALGEAPAIGERPDALARATSAVAAVLAARDTPDALVEPALPAAPHPSCAGAAAIEDLAPPPGGGPTVFVLADPRDVAGLAHAARLAAAWPAGGAGVALVQWDAAHRHLLQIAREGGGAPHRIGSSSCVHGGWLLAPSLLSPDPAEGGLPEADILMEARKLGLRSACIYDPIDLAALPRSAPQQDRLARALMLADLILPTSRLAGDELCDHLILRELAETGPPMHRLAQLSAREGGEASYAESLDALLAAASAPAPTVTGVYLVTPAAAPEWPFLVDQPLTLGLEALGVNVEPLEWRPAEGRLALHAAGQDAAQTAGMAPGAPGSPHWLLIDGLPDGPALEAIIAYAHRTGLRTAGLAQRWQADSVIEAVASGSASHLSLDRLIVGRSSDFEALNRALLRTRARLTSAEERFRLVRRGASGRNTPTPRSRPRRPPQRVNLLAAFEREAQTQAGVMLSAWVQAREAYGGEATLTLCTPADQQAGVATLIAMLPQAHRTAVSVVKPCDWGAAANTATLCLAWGGASFVEALADDAAAHGSATLAPLGLGASAPGVIEVDFADPAKLAAAIARFCDDAARLPFEAAALGRASASQRTEAAELLSLLAEDEPHRRLEPLRRSGRARPAPAPERPRLSLCISTYNRAGWLDVSLRNIFSQLRSGQTHVEVVVVDNAATDSTPEVVKPWLDRPDFHYHRNARNVGMLGNLAVTAQRATGRHIWILGDDDLTRAGAINKVVDLLGSAPDLGLIYLNYGYSSEDNPSSIDNIPDFLDKYNVLEPAGSDISGTVAQLAAQNENFYTAIYSHIYRRDHGVRAYCQNTSGRIFSTLLSCVPTAYYVFNFMAQNEAYWIGEPSLVVNSNVSWAAYGPLFDLEQLPRVWDLAERRGAPSRDVDRRRANRLWLVDMMWRQLFSDDAVGNAAFVSAARVLNRLKHLPEIDAYIPAMRDSYAAAHADGHPAARLPVADIFSAWA